MNVRNCTRASQSTLRRPTSLLHHKKQKHTLPPSLHFLPTLGHAYSIGSRPPPVVQLLRAFDSSRRSLWTDRHYVHGATTGPNDFKEEEAVRSAILEKALKARQPTDLLLRCTSPSLHHFVFRLVDPIDTITLLGTILDANGSWRLRNC